MRRNTATRSGGSPPGRKKRLLKGGRTPNGAYKEEQIFAYVRARICVCAGVRDFFRGRGVLHGKEADREKHKAVADRSAG